MDFSRLFIWSRLSLVVLVCGLVFGLGGNFLPDDTLATPGVITDTFDERDEEEFFDGGLPADISKSALLHSFNWVSMGLGHVPKIGTLELNATGPPSV
jgi:hypothetical protein